MIDISVKAAYKDFINDRKSYCDESTCKYYEQNIRFFLNYLELEYQKPVELLLFSELDKKVVQNYVAYLRSKPKFENHPFKVSVSKKGVLKNSTIRIYVRAVKVFMNYIRDEELTDISFSRKIKLPKDDSRLHLPLFQYEVDAIDSLFSQNTEMGLRNLCILHLMLDAGLRSEEVIGLKVNDVDFDKRIIRVLDSKNHKSRIIPLAWNLKLYLECYLEFRIPALDEYIIRKAGTGGGINYNVIKQLFFRIRGKVNVNRLHPHLLRHTFAVAYLVGGGNLEFLRDMMGHSDYTVTKQYVKMSNQYRMMGAGVYKLDDIFYVATR